ncbi:MAG: STAS domain-containing protein [Phycisphaerales bacterium]|nr:STAS domain-containing protein [Phycisphaerae bacterium]NNF44534.1 STAS domain-containing protein [Phycisphaerales bacterium]NNM24560.1 STAS domain-containing protein [Phycisphaerales bacterium]
MSAHPSHLAVRHEGGMTIVVITRAAMMDPEYLRAVAEELEELGRDLEEPWIVVDLECVEFLASPALGTLLVAHRDLEARGGGLRLANVRRGVRAVLELVNVPKLIPIFDSVAAAVHGNHV